MKDCEASDGLPARVGRRYAARKLDWLDAYLVSALTVTKNNPDRTYVDLFAGPGLSVIHKTKEEMSSGALRALRARGQGEHGKSFTAAYFVNLNKTHDRALRERVRQLSESECSIPRDSIHSIPEDANIVAPALLAGLPPLGYTFVFADPESAGQLPWRTVEAIRGVGHRRVDLYMLFPYGMDITRNMPWGGITDPQRAIHDAFFGTMEWQGVIAEFPSTSQRRHRRRAVLDFYLTRLQRLWTYALIVEDVALRGDQNLYYMLLATNHDVAMRIARGVMKAAKKKIGQGELLLGDC